MKHKKQKVLVVGKNDGFHSGLEQAIKNAGHEPLKYSYADSINDLESKDYLSISSIICDGQNIGFVNELFHKRNQADMELPFYVIQHGSADDYLSLLTPGTGPSIDALIKTKDAEETVQNIMSQVLALRIDLNKPVVMIKIGGSAFDHMIEKESLSVKQTLDFCTDMQKKGEHQIVLVPGAGVRGDYVKKLYKIHGYACPDVDSSHTHQMQRATEDNMADLKNMVGWENAWYYTPSQLTGKEPFRFAPNTPLQDRVNHSKIFDTDKIIIMSSSPRHLRIIYDKGHPLYPQVPAKDSDAQTILLAELFGVARLGLVKRTDDIYLRDPYDGFETSEAEWYKRQHKDPKFLENKQLTKVSAKNLLNGKNKDYRISRVGAWDGENGHLIEDSALEFFLRSDIIKEICIASHIAPFEMYTSKGNHIITGEKLPPNTSEQEYRNKNLLAFINNYESVPRIVK